MSTFPDDRSTCRCWGNHETAREKIVFLKNASIHDRARVPPILPFLLAFIAGLLGNVAKFFIAPYLACVITLILAVFFLNRSTKKISQNRIAILALLFVF